MYIKLNSGYDRARNLCKLMNGVNPQDLVVKPPIRFAKTPKPQKEESSVLLGLAISVKNIINRFSKGK